MAGDQESSATSSAVRRPLRVPREPCRTRSTPAPETVEIRLEHDERRHARVGARSRRGMTRDDRRGPAARAVPVDEGERPLEDRRVRHRVRLGARAETRGRDRCRRRRRPATDAAPVSRSDVRAVRRGPGDAARSTVEVRVRSRPTRSTRVVRRAATALDRWCRHAAVPIEATSRSGEAPRRCGSIGRSRSTSARRGRGADDGRAHGVVAHHGGAPYVGFFNHG